MFANSVHASFVSGFEVNRMYRFKSALFCLALTAPICVAQNSSSNIDLLSFAMPGAKVLAGAHVDTAKNSAFGQFVLSQIQSGNPALQQFIEHTGVDPRTDISEVLAAGDSTPGPSTHGVFAAHGNFSNAIPVLESEATTHGATITHNTGVDIIHAERNACIALYTDGATALGGDCDSVQAALASASTKAPAGSNLFTKAEQIRAQDDLWFSSVLPVGAFGNAVPKQLDTVLSNPLLKAIQETSGGVRFVAAGTTTGPAVQVSGELLMDTPANAASLNNVVKFIV